MGVANRMKALLNCVCMQVYDVVGVHAGIYCIFFFHISMQKMCKIRKFLTTAKSLNGLRSDLSSDISRYPRLDLEKLRVLR